MKDETFHYDSEFAFALLGKVVLAGLTYRNRQNEVEAVEQVFGIVESVDPGEGIALRLQGERAGERFVLPPVTSKFERAGPGEYRLKSSKETVTDPDWLILWTIHRKEGGPEGSED